MKSGMLIISGTKYKMTWAFWLANDKTDKLTFTDQGISEFGLDDIINEVVSRHKVNDLYILKEHGNFNVTSGYYKLDNKI